jgi:hypothetical protein
MKKSFAIIPILSLLIIGGWASQTSAHQPRIVEGNATEVVDPEVSKAYYGELSGEPHIYTINATEDFDLYVGILMPYADDSMKDVTAEIYKGDEMIQALGGQDAQWGSMFEFFGQSTYWDGGEYRERVSAGEYTISVWSINNDSKYSLAVGLVEAFDGNETINALTLIPEIKRNFFNESPISFIKSPFGWGYILILYILAFASGFIYRFLLKKLAKGSVQGVQQNIGKYDRAVRFTLWLGLLLWAITTSWNPILLFFSGFTLFEAIFSWCGLYAAIGKNTCPS